MWRSAHPDTAARPAHPEQEGAAELAAARESERRLLARTLHDHVGQLLTGVRFELAAAVEKFRAAPSADCGAIVDRLQAAVGLVELSTRAVRDLATDLHPPALDRAGLVAAARWEAAIFQHRTGIRCDLSIGTFEPSAAQGRAFYAILLEALTNVARHASASAVSIRFRQTRRRAVMQVRDNGRGLRRPEAANGDTLGLAGMRERAEALGGAVRLLPMRSGGARLLASLPLERQEDGTGD